MLEYNRFRWFWALVLSLLLLFFLFLSLLLKFIFFSTDFLLSFLLQNTHLVWFYVLNTVPSEKSTDTTGAAIEDHNSVRVIRYCFLFFVYFLFMNNSLSYSLKSSAFSISVIIFFFLSVPFLRSVSIFIFFQKP